MSKYAGFAGLSKYLNKAVCYQADLYVHFPKNLPT